jgi:hypothetical protein
MVVGDQDISTVDNSTVDISTMDISTAYGHFDNGLFDSDPDISTVTVKITLFSQIFHF